VYLYSEERGCVGLREEQHRNGEDHSFLKAHHRLFMPARVLLSPEFQEQRWHRPAHDPGSAHDGVAGGAQVSVGYIFAQLIYIYGRTYPKRCLALKV
jgi:hypothetical protein